jgi:alpha/beta hydrolase family protein
MLRRIFQICFLLAFLLINWSLYARVTRVEISSRHDVLGGKTFGDAGAYERVVGRVYFSVPVANPHNQRIVDLGNAENLKNGEVEFSADFVAVRPKDAHKGNGSMLLEIPNRGHSRILSLVDGGDEDLAKDSGDGWLLRNGFTVVSLGWQWDADGADALKLYTPIAKEHGKTITGLLRGDFMLPKAMDDVPLGHYFVGRVGGDEYPVSAPNDARNALTVRDTREGPRMAIPRRDWDFAHVVGGKLVPSNRHIHLTGGFQPGKIYEYVYVVADPVVAGCGFAAVRDFAAYAKHASDAVTPAARVYGEGISQNGRLLRDFLYQGFDADEDGQMALDGVLAHVAGAGRGNFNYRFAQPSRDAQPTSSIFFPTDIFPFTDQPETDPVSGETAGLLDRVVKDKIVPKIFFSNTSYEYWGRVAALIHVSADGKRDMDVSEKVRIYHFTGLQHYSGPFPPAKGEADTLGQLPQSPLPVKYFWRSMIANMDAWVRNGTAPPASSYPKIADGTLVPFSEFAFPSIPRVNCPREANAAYHMDYGPRFAQGIFETQPPKAGAQFPVLVPAVDEDGNERAGVRLPEIAVPLATYTGWSLRDPSIGAPEQRCAFVGSYVPFARTAEERKKSGDPRKSLAERYGSREDYLSRFTKALDELVAAHWILAEDRAAMLRLGAREWVEATQ